MKQGKLPEGWQWVRLGDVCAVNPPRRASVAEADEPTTFVPMSAIDALSGTIARPEVRPYAEVAHGYTHFERGDVLFAKITPCMQNGKHAIVREALRGRGFGTTELHVLRPGLQVTPEWIHWFVRQPDVLTEAALHFTGSGGQQRLPEAYLRALMVPLPPVHEQRRVSSLLEEHLAAAGRARAAAAAQLEAARSLPPAYLREVFERSDARAWPTVRIGDFAETCSGSTPDRGRPEYYGGRIPWVKTGELRDDTIEQTEEHVTELAVRSRGLRLMPRDTLLIAMYGQGQTRGRTGLLATEATTNQACFAILPRPDRFDTRYLQFWFRYSYERLRRSTESRGGSQPNLNGIFLRQLAVPLPDVTAQQTMALLLTERVRSARALRDRIVEQRDVLDAVPASILQRAFRGEL